MNDVIKFMTPIKYQDKRGAWHTKYTPRQVFCDARDVSMTEFFEGGRNGLNPEYRFTVFHGDYNGEVVLEYNEKTYSIYRTYRANGDYIELYAERQGGTNGKASDSR